MSDRWLPWIVKASLAAGVVFAIGMLLMGLPGAVFLELVAGPRRLPLDSAWPLAIRITQVGSLLIVPASIVLRLAIPDLAGWRHALATAGLTFVATFIFAIFLTAASH